MATVLSADHALGNDPCFTREQLDSMPNSYRAYRGSYNEPRLGGWRRQPVWKISSLDHARSIGYDAYMAECAMEHAELAVVSCWEG